MFLLEIGELLEEWTHKKSVAGLAESLSLTSTASGGLCPLTARALKPAAWEPERPRPGAAGITSSCP